MICDSSLYLTLKSTTAPISDVRRFIFSFLKDYIPQNIEYRDEDKVLIDCMNSIPESRIEWLNSELERVAEYRQFSWLRGAVFMLKALRDVRIVIQSLFAYSQEIFQVEIDPLEVSQYIRNAAQDLAFAMDDVPSEASTETPKWMKTKDIRDINDYVRSGDKFKPRKTVDFGISAASQLNPRYLMKSRTTSPAPDSPATQLAYPPGRSRTASPSKRRTESGVANFTAHVTPRRTVTHLITELEGILSDNARGVSEALHGFNVALGDREAADGNMFGSTEPPDDNGDDSDGTVISHSNANSRGPVTPQGEEDPREETRHRRRETGRQGDGDTPPPLLDVPKRGILRPNIDRMASDRTDLSEMSQDPDPASGRGGAPHTGGVALVLDGVMDDDEFSRSNLPDRSRNFDPTPQNTKCSPTRRASMQGFGRKLAASRLNQNRERKTAGDESDEEWETDDEEEQGWGLMVLALDDFMGAKAVEVIPANLAEVVSKAMNRPSTFAFHLGQAGRHNPPLPSDFITMFAVVTPVPNDADEAKKLLPDLAENALKRAYASGMMDFSCSVGLSLLDIEDPTSDTASWYHRAVNSLIIARSRGMNQVGPVHPPPTHALASPTGKGGKVTLALPRTHRMSVPAVMLTAPSSLRNDQRDRNPDSTAEDNQETFASEVKNKLQTKPIKTIRFNDLLKGSSGQEKSGKESPAEPFLKPPPGGGGSKDKDVAMVIQSPFNFLPGGILGAGVGGDGDDASDEGSDYEDKIIAVGLFETPGESPARLPTTTGLVERAATWGVGQMQESYRESYVSMQRPLMGNVTVDLRKDDSDEGTNVREVMRQLKADIVNTDPEHFLELLSEEPRDLNHNENLYGDTVLLLAMGMRRNADGHLTADGKTNGEVVDFLLKNVPEVDVNLTNNDGFSALMVSAMKGDVALTRRLLRCRSNPNLRSSSGKSALMLAVQNSVEFTPGSQSEIVAVLLNAKGIEPDAKDKHGRTALSFASRMGSVQVCKLLLDKRANVNTMGTHTFGKTPLMWAACTSNPDLLKLFLDSKADPNLKTQNGSSSLHLAASQPDPEICILLADYGANVNAKNNAGLTPLIIAVSALRRDVVHMLLFRGADALDNRALEIAKKKKAKGIIEIFENAMV